MKFQLVIQSQFFFLVENALFDSVYRTSISKNDFVPCSRITDWVTIQKPRDQDGDISTKTQKVIVIQAIDISLSKFKTRVVRKPTKLFANLCKLKLHILTNKWQSPDNS